MKNHSHVRIISWLVKKAERQRIDDFELWCWRRLLRVLWTARRSNQSILKEISPEYSLEELMLHLKLQHFGHRCEELTHWKKPWCWERLKAGGEGDDRGWDGWMASLTWRTWIWASSGRWWQTGKPGVLQSMGSQRVRHDWAIEQRQQLLNNDRGTSQACPPGDPKGKPLPVKARARVEGEEEPVEYEWLLRAWLWSECGSPVTVLLRGIRSTVCTLEDVTPWARPRKLFPTSSTSLLYCPRSRCGSSACALTLVYVSSSPFSHLTKERETPLTIPHVLPHTWSQCVKACTKKASKRKLQIWERKVPWEQSRRSFLEGNSSRAEQPPACPPQPLTCLGIQDKSAIVTITKQFLEWKMIE